MESVHREPQPEDFGLTPEYLAQALGDKDALVADLKRIPLEIESGPSGKVLWAGTFIQVVVWVGLVNILDLPMLIILAGVFISLGLTRSLLRPLLIKWESHKRCTQAVYFNEARERMDAYKKAWQEACPDKQWERPANAPARKGAFSPAGFAATLEALGFSIQWLEEDCVAHLAATLEGRTTVYKIKGQDERADDNDLISLHEFLLGSERVHGVMVVAPAGCTHNAEQVLPRILVNVLEQRHLEALDSSTMPHTLKVMLVTGVLEEDFFMEFTGLAAQGAC